MVASTYVIDRYLRPQMVVDGNDILETGSTSGNVRLIRDNDEDEPRFAQVTARLSDAFDHTDVGDGRRGRRDPVPENHFVQHPITVDEDRALHFIDSHFGVSGASNGCVTMRCHNTAWKLSVRAVIASSSTVGTMTQAVALRAV